MTEVDIRKTTITAAIDGRKIEVVEGTTILRAAGEAGIFIPSLCQLDWLPGYGGCRLCIVEVENMRGFPTACTTPVSQGMRISTMTEELLRLRREILELILSEHPYTCLVCRDKENCREYMQTTRKAGTATGCNFCPNNGDCELQRLVDFCGLEEIRFPILYRDVPPVRNNPFYDIDYNLCILCGRCVRVCNEERFSEVLSFVNRGNAALVGTAFGETQKEAGCEYCGACVDVCPTGSLSGKIGKWAGQPDTTTNSHCSFCGVGCPMTVNSREKRIVNIGPAAEKRNNPHQLCVRGKFLAADITHHPDRVFRPHINRQGKWVAVSWDEATGYIAEHLKPLAGEQFGLIGSAHDTVEDSFLLQKFTRQTMRSANVDLYPAPAYPLMVRDIHNYYAADGHVAIDDILEADVVYVLGAQAQWSHAIIENRIRKVSRAAKPVIVACSQATRTADFSTEYHRYPRGGEHLFLQRLAGELVSQQAKKQAVVIVGDEILSSDRAAENISNLMRIAKQCRDRITMLFLLAEGNRYGATMAGMNPQLLPGFVAARKKGFGTKAMLTGKKNIAGLYLIGDVPETPALKRLRFFVQQNMFFTPASRHADVVLPMAGPLEMTGHIVNLEGRMLPLTPVATTDTALPTPAETVNRIAGKMKRKTLFDGSATSVDDQVRSLMQTSRTRKRIIQTRGVSQPDPRSRSKNGSLTRTFLHKHHFHFMGNDLPERVPDLAEMLRE